MVLLCYHYGIIALLSDTNVVLPRYCLHIGSVFSVLAVYRCTIVV